jgi:hypothetical protein
VTARNPFGSAQAELTLQAGTVPCATDSVSTKLIHVNHTVEIEWVKVVPPCHNGLNINGYLIMIQDPDT